MDSNPCSKSTVVERKLNQRNFSYPLKSFRKKRIIRCLNEKSLPICFSFSESSSVEVTILPITILSRKFLSSRMPALLKFCGFIVAAFCLITWMYSLHSSSYEIFHVPIKSARWHLQMDTLLFTLGLDRSIFQSWH